MAIPGRIRHKVPYLAYHGSEVVEIESHLTGDLKIESKDSFSALEVVREGNQMGINRSIDGYLQGRSQIFQVPVGFKIPALQSSGGRQVRNFAQVRYVSRELWVGVAFARGA